MSTIVLMACSASKLQHAEQPRRLYTGPMWQTLRQHIGAIDWRDVFVLSGRYGFICSLNFIQTYEEKLTSERADELIAGGIHAKFGRPSAADIIRPYGKQRAPFDRVICAGAGDYRRVFEAWIQEFKAATIITPDAPVHQVAGGIGEQRSQLGKWLQEFQPHAKAR